eukprot:355855-Chlamydomonas_euryale.AAC.2
MAPRPRWSTPVELAPCRAWACRISALPGLGLAGQRFSAWACRTSALQGLRMWSSRLAGSGPGLLAPGRAWARPGLGLAGRQALCRV